MARKKDYFNKHVVCYSYLMQSGTIFPILLLAPGHDDARILDEVLRLVSASSNFSCILALPSAWTDTNKLDTLGGKIRYISAGFSSAAHTVLHDNELLIETFESTASSAKSSSKIVENFHFIPHADFQRMHLLSKNNPEAWFCYGTRNSSMNSTHICFLRDNEDERSLELIRNARDLPPGHQDAVCLLESRNQNFLSQLETMIRSYKDAEIRTSNQLDEQISQYKKTVTNGVIAPLIAYPGNICLESVRSGVELGRLRSLMSQGIRKTTDTVHEILKLIANPSEVELETPGPAKKRTHLAAMQGLVNLKGIRTDTLFKNGTLSAFVQKNNRLELSQTPQIYFQTTFMQCRLETQGAVSLEAEHLRGLHEARICSKDPEAEGRLDYLQTDASDWLYFDIDLRFPSCSSDLVLNQATPFSLCFETASPVEMRWESGGLERSMILECPPAPTGFAGLIPSKSYGPWVHCAGKNWCFAFGKRRLILKRPGESECLYFLSARMMRIGKKLHLELCPESMFEGLQGRSLSKRMWRFNFALLAIFDPNETVPELDANIEKLLNSPYLGPLSPSEFTTRE